MPLRLRLGPALPAPRLDIAVDPGFVLESVDQDAVNWLFPNPAAVVTPTDVSVALFRNGQIVTSGRVIGTIPTEAPGWYDLLGQLERFAVYATATFSRGRKKGDIVVRLRVPFDAAAVTAQVTDHRGTIQAWKRPSSSGTGKPVHIEQTDRFRPDLEGLRAVAVLLVLIYHAGTSAGTSILPGGFIGVDVFFVLSGFLITGLIVRELRTTGTLSITGFYARRARRLLPAAAVTLLVTLVASVLIVAPPLIPGIAGDIQSAALYVANFRFAIQANDYFHVDSAPSPVLHFWSLSVEEQFYILWPATLLVLFRIRRTSWHRTPQLLVGVAIISIASLIASIWLTGVNAPWAFFSLPTRAWQLGVGAMIAIVASQISMTRRMATVATAGGLLFIIASALVFTQDTPYPGFAAIVPALGAVLVILGGFAPEQTRPMLALSVAPMRFLGRISYSIYLWHWPILVLAAVAWGAALPLPVSVALALVTIPIAAVSQRLVEEPLRYGRLVGLRPGWNLAQAAGIGALIAVAGLAFSVLSEPPTSVAAVPTPTPGPVASGLPGPTPAPTLVPITALVPSLTEAAAAPYFPQFFCHDPTATDQCTSGDPAATKTVVLFGDSHAAQWLAPLQAIAAQQHWLIVNLTQAACPSVEVDVWLVPQNRDYSECAGTRQSEFDRIQALHPDLVLIANRSKYKIFLGGTYGLPDATGYDATWQAGLTATVLKLQAMAGAVGIIGDTPGMAFDAIECVSQHASSYDRVCVGKPDSVLPNDLNAIDAAVAATTHAGYIDPTSWLCSDVACPVVTGQYFMYFGGYHLTPPYATTLADELAATVVPLLPAN